MFSPSFAKLSSSITCSFDSTPVILNSIFLFNSPFSYPNKVWFFLILSAVLITLVTPVQPKNWLIDLDV